MALPRLMLAGAARASKEQGILPAAQVQQVRILRGNIMEADRTAGLHRPDQPTVGDQIERGRLIGFEWPCRYQGG